MDNSQQREPNALLKLINKLQEKGLNFIAKNEAKIVGLLVVGVVTALVLSTLSVKKTTNHPEKTKDFASTSVMITNLEQTSGGTGVILRSSETFSEILTNKHVCRLVEKGGLVVSQSKVNLISAIKKYPIHDLCLVKVYENLHVNTEVAETSPETYGDAIISGHPALLPHVLTKGNFSGSQIISLIVGLKKCTEEDRNGQYGLYCLMLGGLPIIQHFESQLVTGTILPGSSGSGVFNSKGQISALVFAGRGRELTYAFAVPHKYVKDFIDTESAIPYENTNITKYDDVIYRIFDKQNEICGTTENASKFKNLCSTVKEYMIWRKND